MKKIILYLLAALIIAALVAGGIKLRHKRQQQLADAPTVEQSAWAVETAVVKRGRVTRGFPTLALLKGASEVAVAPRLGGIILEMGAREGERIKEGTVIARIDTRELEDKLASLEAQLAGAKVDAQRKARDARRVRKLLKDHSISESQADQTLSAARSAREKVHSLRSQMAAERIRLGYAEVKAPFDGVISARLADPGDLAAPGKPLYRLIATGSGRLEVRLPAEVLGQVHPGTEVDVRIGNETLNLQATRVFPSLDERSLGRLEVDLDHIPAGVVPGALLPARVVLQALDDALTVPPNALILGEHTGKGGVYRIDPENHTLSRVPVKILLRGKEGVALSGDLQPGDQVVTGHETTLLRLRAGDRVVIHKADALSTGADR